MTSLKTSKPRLCLCGCGEEVGKRATFVPGHDSKLHSRWLAVRRGQSKEKLTREQIEYAESHWQFTPAPAKAKAAKAKVKGGKGAKAAKAAKAKRKVSTKSPATVAAEQAE